MTIRLARPRGWRSHRLDGTRRSRADRGPGWVADGQPSTAPAHRELSGSRDCKDGGTPVGRPLHAHRASSVRMACTPSQQGRIGPIMADELDPAAGKQAGHPSQDAGDGDGPRKHSPKKLRSKHQDHNHGDQSRLAHRSRDTRRASMEAGGRPFASQTLGVRAGTHSTRLAIYRENRQRLSRMRLCC